MRAALKSKLLKKTNHNHTSEPAPAPEPAAPVVAVDDDEFYDADEHPQEVLHPNAHEEGGLAFSNKELLASQRGAIVEVGKELGRKLLTGSFNLINLSMPVKMFESRSYLQKLADVWVYPRLLDEAVAATDPVERMRWTVTWFVAGLQHVFQSWKKPFNPLLGETWQATQGDGRCSIFMEQISHHPPISAFEMLGPGGAYLFTGHSQPDVSYKANAIKTTAKGYRAIDFRGDGTRIEIVYPSYYMRGILYSDMPRGDVTGTVTFTDRKNSLMCEMQFGKVEGSDAELLRRPDSLQGVILPLPPGHRAGDPLPSYFKKEGSSLKTASLGRLWGSDSGSAAPPADKALSACCGNWLSHLDWDSERRWTLVEEMAEEWVPVPDPLPSDSRFRLDLATLKEGDQAGAQAAKEALENRQRHDAKTRKEANPALQH
mmetsp:Transcript_1426/g.4252  ORF Transcript_1426/g.4252 Transcript_1426/m.4252 type:complete len:430 (+) Transcript_1426:162-1451(+)